LALAVGPNGVKCQHVHEHVVKEELPIKGFALGLVNVQVWIHNNLHAWTECVSVSKSGASGKNVMLRVAREDSNELENVTDKLMLIAGEVPIRSNLVNWPPVRTDTIQVQYIIRSPINGETLDNLEVIPKLEAMVKLDNRPVMVKPVLVKLVHTETIIGELRKILVQVMRLETFLDNQPAPIIYSETRRLRTPMIILMIR